MLRFALSTIALLAIVYLASPVLSAAQSDDADLDRQFAQTVRPFLSTYCTRCHGGAKPEGQFDLRQYSTIQAVIRDHSRWSLLVDRLAAREMPPKRAKQPPDDARQQVIDWVRAARRNEATKHAGDPGIVLARRLSNAEYNYTIRDLTGV